MLCVCAHVVGKGVHIRREIGEDAEAVCEVEAHEEGDECEASGAANKEEGSKSDFRADSRVVDNALPLRLRRGVLAPGKHANEGIKGQDGEIQG